MYNLLFLNYFILEYMIKDKSKAQKCVPRHDKGWEIRITNMGSIAVESLNKIFLY
jgi:hypothetical protein